MERANYFLCPNCRTALKSLRGVRIGKMIKCLKCEVAFTVRPEDTEHLGRVNRGRLGIVLAGALLCLLGGGGLAYYCFATNVPSNVLAAVPSTPQDPSAKSDPEPTPPPLPTPKKAAVTTAEQRQIDDAIAKGVWYLKDRVLSTNTWGDSIASANVPNVGVGFASLPGLTLLECGVPGNDPVVQKAAGYVRQQAPRLDKAMDTYQRALAILFLDRLHEYKDEELIQYLALCLIAGQRSDDGGWGYNCPSLDRQATPKLLQELRDGKLSLVQWRKDALDGKAFDPGRSDNSNTQFAVLALWVARRHNVAIEQSIALVEDRFRKTQIQAPGMPDQDGAWPYNPESGLDSNPWRTMTCSGLLGLAVSHGVNLDAKAKTTKALEDQAIRKGLVMLSHEIDRPGEERAMDLYFLWSLERVAVLYDLREIESKDWYAWGRKWLLAHQQPTGNWQDGAYWGNNPVLDTCFALLFLKRANLAQDLTSKLQLLHKD